MAREQMDALIDGHFRAEEQGDPRAVVDGFEPGAEHDVASRAGGPIHGGERIAAFYRALLRDLRIDRFETIYRRYGEDHAVDESILHATAIGRPFGLDGRRWHIQIRLLHLFEFSEELTTRESAWLDMAALQQQLAREPYAGTSSRREYSTTGKPNGDSSWTLPVWLKPSRS